LPFLLLSNQSVVALHILSHIYFSTIVALVQSSRSLLESLRRDNGMSFDNDTKDQVNNGTETPPSSASINYKI